MLFELGLQAGAIRNVGREDLRLQRVECVVVHGIPDATCCNSRMWPEVEPICNRRIARRLRIRSFFPHRPNFVRRVGLLRKAPAGNVPQAQLCGARERRDRGIQDQSRLMLIRTSQISAPVSQAAAFALKPISLCRETAFPMRDRLRAIIDGLITGLFHRGDDALMPQSRSVCLGDHSPASWHWRCCSQSRLPEFAGLACPKAKWP